MTRRSSQQRALPFMWGYSLSRAVASGKSNVRVLIAFPLWGAGLYVPFDGCCSEASFIHRLCLTTGEGMGETARNRRAFLRGLDPERLG